MSIYFSTACIPKPVRQICGILKDFSPHIVGGIIRDILCSNWNKIESTSPITKTVAGDWDLASAATPKQAISLLNQAGFSTVPLALEHGTIGILARGKLYEHTTFRQDVACDGRHAKVKFSKSIEEDLARRDFTINALALCPFTGEIKDYYEGINDLKNLLIKSVGNPEARFLEDHLRIFRAIRFAAHINGKIEAKTWTAIIKLKHLISRVSKERIRDEFLKLMKTPKPSIGVELMLKSNLLSWLLPQIADLFTKYPEKGRHSQEIMNNLSAKDPLLRFAGLLHIMAEVPGEKNKNIGLLIELLQQLRFSNKEIKRLKLLFSLSKYYDDFPKNQLEQRRMLFHCGWANLPDFLRFYFAHLKTQTDTDRKKISSELRSLYKIKKKQPCLSLSELAINGDDLIALGLKPGIIYSQILNYLMEKVLEEPNLNEKETLLKIVKKDFTR